jgi:hypothetical protein
MTAILCRDSVNEDIYYSLSDSDVGISVLVFSKYYSDTKASYDTTYIGVVLSGLMNSFPFRKIARNASLESEIIENNIQPYYFFSGESRRWLGGAYNVDDLTNS